MPIAKAHYHHLAMMGLWSLKSLLPAIEPDLDYAELEEVQEGSAVEAA